MQGENIAAFCWAPPKPARCGVRMSGSMRPDRQSPSRSWCATCTGWPLPGGFRNHAAPSTCWCQRATRTCCARGTGWGLASNRRTPYARCRTRRGPRRPGLWCAGHGAATCPRSPGSRSSCHDSTASPPPSRPSRCRAMRSAWPDGRRTSTTGPTPPSWPSSTAPSSAQASAVRSSCRAATRPSPGPTTQASSPLPLSSRMRGAWALAERSAKPSSRGPRRPLRLRGDRLAGHQPALLAHLAPARLRGILPAAASSRRLLKHAGIPRQPRRQAGHLRSPGSGARAANRPARPIGTPAGAARTEQSRRRCIGSARRHQ